MSEAIRVAGLSKSFGGHKVLNGLDLTVESGDFLTIFGANGAGKTTLLRVMATLTDPDDGTVVIHGHDTQRAGAEVRARIGVIAHQPLIYDEFTVRENLSFYGRLYGVSHLMTRIEEVACRVGLQDILDNRVKTLSHGLRKRAAIARAILHSPVVILADEPESGLDPVSAESLGNILAGEGDEKATVVMVTHNLERGIVLGNRVAVLSDGCIAYEECSKAADMNTLRQFYYQPPRAVA